MIGSQLGHYRIISKLGEGGMGEVYLAEDGILNRKVALKILSEQMASDTELLARFEREAKVLAALSHPNIVAIHSVGEYESHRFMAMELVEGDTLDQIVPADGLPFHRLMKIALPIVDALRTAHEHNIVHRDMKPVNIIVGKRDTVKILDFGIAKLWSVKDDLEMTEAETVDLSCVTKAGSIIGTIPYMSPEQLQGKQTDNRSDIFSMGVVLYEMATGRHPFTGATAADLISSILRDDPEAITHYRDDLPRHLWRIIRHCLEKDPNRRYQVTLDVYNEMEALSEEVRVGEQFREQKSVAVLPFTDMSEGRDQQYFCDGIAEELINRLAGEDDLRVAARTSAFSFRDRGRDIREIGSALNVSTVLEGSVRRSGNRVRIRVQLADVRSGYHLWSEQFDREIENIFVLQDEIAQRVAEQLKLKFREDRSESWKKRDTVDQEAYHLYLKGRYHWNRRTEEGVLTGLRLFKEATQKDPEYARAYTGLADCYSQLGDYGFLPPGEAWEGARLSALKAIAIDESLAEAHASLAYPTMLYNWDWETAEREFRRAIELKPEYATARQLYAEYLTAMGRMREGIVEVRRAQELDPLSLIVNTVAGWVYYRARRFGQAIDQCQRTLELDPDFALAHHLLGWIYLQESRFDDAVAEASKSVDLSSRGTLMTAALGNALAISGCALKAREILEELETRSMNNYVPPYDIALVHMGLRQNEQALEWLEAALEERYGWLVYLNADPIWDPLRKEKRFASLVKRIGLPAERG